MLLVSCYATVDVHVCGTCTRPVYYNNPISCLNKSESVSYLKYLMVAREASETLAGLHNQDLLIYFFAYLFGTCDPLFLPRHLLQYKLVSIVIN